LSAEIPDSATFLIFQGLKNSLSQPGAGHAVCAPRLPPRPRGSWLPFYERHVVIILSCPKFGRPIPQIPQITLVVRYALDHPKAAQEQQRPRDSRVSPSSSPQNLRLGFCPGRTSQISQHCTARPVRSHGCGGRPSFIFGALRRG
jgi:hypothetical protein